MKRVIAPDAWQYGDSGANTLQGAATIPGGLHLPTLTRWGLGHLVDIPTLAPVKKAIASYGKLIELSEGKDTISGHFELAGQVISRAFATFPHGFSSDVIDRFCRENQLSGVLGNHTASGTQIIQELGEEHIRTGQPIVYTSADSVFQIACDEATFGLDRLYAICRNARIFCDEINIARVIARPFVRDGAGFVRTRNRKDFAIAPPHPTLMDALQAAGVKVVGFGKVPSIYNYRGFDAQIHTTDNEDGMHQLAAALAAPEQAFYFINLIDFDMLYGHRRDVIGFARALMAFDRQLAGFVRILTPDDLVLVTADHGNDPTFSGTDHTREMVPVLAFQPGRPGKNLGVRTGFYHLAATIFEFLTGQNFMMGENFLLE